MSDLSSNYIRTSDADDEMEIGTYSEKILKSDMLADLRKQRDKMF